MKFSEIFKMSLVAIRSTNSVSVDTAGYIVGVIFDHRCYDCRQVLQNSIEDGLSGLGSNTFQVQKHGYGESYAVLKAMKKKIYAMNKD